MAEKLLLRSDTEMLGAGALEPPPEPLPPLDDGLLLPQAATTSAALAAMAAAAADLVTERKKTTSLMGGTIPGHRLLSSPTWPVAAGPLALDRNPRAHLINVSVNIPVTT